MAPDSETTSGKVEKHLPDVSLPEVCSLSQENFKFHVTGSSNLDRGQNRHDVYQSSNGKVDDDDGIPVPEVQLYPPGQVCLEWAEVHKIGAGLVNLGNTCFLNTVIQCLTYCPPLANYLLQGDHDATCKNFEFCMMCELQKHMRQVFQRSGDVIKPLCIYQNLKYIADHFQFGQQEDAHEFLRFVIDNLWQSSIYSHPEDDKLDTATRETTIINHIFGGYNRSQVVCLQCNLKSDKFEHFMDFILDIQNAHSLEKAVEQFVKPELLEKENAYRCPKCNALVPAKKTFTIHRPPNVATFQLKRFHYYKSYGKITKHISYPENFDLRPYMSQRKGDSLLYKLNAVLVHAGQNCNSGHYYCYIRNSNGSWYLMDDTKVQKVSLHDVLNQQAYVLFYIRSSHNSIHLKKNGMSSIIDFQNPDIGSPGEGDTVQHLSGPKKNLSFQKASECDDKLFENSNCSAVRCPSQSPQKFSVNSFAQPCSELNTGPFNGEYDSSSVDSKYSRAFKFNCKSSYTYNKHFTQRKNLRKAKRQKFSSQHKSAPSGEGCLISRLGDSYSHLSSFEKCSQDSGYRNSSMVCANDVRTNVNYRSRESGFEGYKNINSAEKYQSFAKSRVQHNRSCEGGDFYVSSKDSVSKNPYSGERNTYAAIGNSANLYQSYYGSSNKSINAQCHPESLQRYENYNYSKNNYINNRVQDYQKSEKLYFPNHKDDYFPRKADYRTFSDRERHNETVQNNARHFSERPESERHFDFRNGYVKKRCDNAWLWRNERSPFPSIWKDYDCQIYQGKMKHRKHYFSCSMDHYSSQSFPKYNGFHRPSSSHKHFSLNIC